MPNLTQNCSKCTRQFYILEQEQFFLKQREMAFPAQCPTCRQKRRLKLRGEDRLLFKATCKKCTKEIIVSYDPTKVTNTILCREDFQQYLMENDFIIKEPLPE
ncbi:MAG: hypothetical protein NTZ20_01095 [Candidatus Levybacteria bacterium]|nr:hypothetical protein [Candidatus Levybacteria bacterium]MSU26269.1 hypothetical protein [Candidatus Levybacteria bacterium]